MNPQNQNMQDIHEIQSLWEVAFPWLVVLSIALMSLAVLGLGIWLLRRILRKRKQKPTPVQTPELRESPREAALNALKLLKPQDPAVFYLQLEALLKKYLEAIYTESAIDHSLIELAQFSKMHSSITHSNRQWKQMLQQLAGNESVNSSLEQLALSPQSASYEKLAQILSYFLNRVQSTQATGFTATELVLFLRQQAGPQGPNHQIEALLERGTRAKFANAQISEQDMQQDLLNTQTFIKGYTL